MISCFSNEEMNKRQGEVKKKKTQKNKSSTSHLRSEPMCTVVAALVLKKCENRLFFSRSVACCSHSLSTEELRSPWGKHGVGGRAGLALLLREDRQPGHREAAGEVRPGWQLPAEGQRHGAGPLLSVCEVSGPSSWSLFCQSTLRALLTMNCWGGEGWILVSSQSSSKSTSCSSFTSAFWRLKIVSALCQDHTFFWWKGKSEPHQCARRSRQSKGLTLSKLKFFSFRN